MINGPLTGTVVLDLTRVLAGPFATGLIAEQGARVIKVEIDDGVGDHIRNYPPFGKGDMSTVFRRLHHDKESITINLKSEEGLEQFRQLVAHADVVVENYRPGVMDRLGIGHEDIKEINPGITTVSISGYGQDGPHSSRPAFNTALGAESGFMVSNYPEGEPKLDALMSADTVSGLMAFSAVLGDVFQKAQNPAKEGTHIDISMLEVMAYLQSHQIAQYSTEGSFPHPDGKNHLLLSPVGIYSTDAGNDSIVISAATNWQFVQLCKALDRPEWLDDERFSTTLARSKEENTTALRSEIESVLNIADTEYWLQKLTEYQVSCSSINPISKVLDHPQLLARDAFVSMEGAESECRLAGHPIRLPELERPEMRGDAPKLGEHNHSISAELESTGTLGSIWPKCQPNQPKQSQPENIMEGVVVLDLTRFHSGPVATKLMTEQGARVIQVEKPLPAPTPTRSYEPRTEGEDSTFFRWLHSGQESIELDLRTEREQFLDLVKHADVIVENFPGGKMKELGLSYEELKEVNPHIILTSLSGYGQDGPYNSRPAFNSVLEAEVGFTATNNPKDSPQLDALMPGSTIAGMFAFAGTLSALITRENNEVKQGTHVDVSMLEVLAYLQNLQLMQYTAHGEEIYPGGVDHLIMSPVGVFSVNKGTEHIVFNAAPQSVFERLCKALDIEGCIQDERFKNHEARFSNRSELREIIEQVLNNNTVEYWKERLDEFAVPSSPVNSPSDLLTHEQLLAREAFIPVKDAPDGLLVPSHPIRSNCIKREILLEPSPKLGEHSRKIAEEVQTNNTLGSFLLGVQRPCMGEPSILGNLCGGHTRQKPDNERVN